MGREQARVARRDAGSSYQAAFDSTYVPDAGATAANRNSDMTARLSDVEPYPS
jgi:hypothetical protein